MQFFFLRQLTKEQLVSVLPLLLNCLESQEVVVYTYAAVALDRILSMRVGGSTTLMYVFPTLSVHLSALSSSLQVLIRGRASVRVTAFECPPRQDWDTTQPGAHCGERLPHALCVCAFSSPYILCLMEIGVARVVITAKGALVGEYVTVLERLINILRNVAQNPSNPNFDQYIFESISGLIL